MNDEIEIPWRDVTCHTEGCHNADVTIRMQCVEHVICGSCMNTITDVVIASDPSESEEPDEHQE